ncbi:hypothetical protein EZV62_003178 [Acer yangbiense]|uniref:Uncharacterized protein n=1 Tax=Acer yangbiense TaxID=1000413 RepID=A0A5C7IG67_9ROSI|nr:hypothetical protein EZV62_003178 [Acer yangbiense]
MLCSRAEDKAEYLKPSQLFRETMKGDYYNPVFLGFSFTDKHVRLAISDDCNANTYFDAYTRFGPSRSGFPRDDTLLEKLVDVVQWLQNDPVEKYELMGLIVDDNNSVNPTFICNQFGSLFWGITFPVERSELQKRLEVLSAEHMLQEMVDEDKEREDKDLEMKDSERKNQCKIIQ